MGEKEFFHSTLRYIMTRFQGIKEEKEEKAKLIDFLAWRIGYYIMPAVGAVLDTKHKIKYPENPLENEAEKPIQIEGMPEKEIARIHEAELEKLDSLARVTLGVAKNGGE